VWWLHLLHLLPFVGVCHHQKIRVRHLVLMTCQILLIVGNKRLVHRLLLFNRHLLRILRILILDIFILFASLWEYFNHLVEIILRPAFLLIFLLLLLVEGFPGVCENIIRLNRVLTVEFGLLGFKVQTAKNLFIYCLYWGWRVGLLYLHEWGYGVLPKKCLVWLWVFPSEIIILIYS